MPLFEYLCPDCQQTHELLVRNQQETLQCPQCGSAKLQRQLSVIASPVISGSSGACRTESTSSGGGCGRPQCGGGGCMGHRH